MRTSHSLRALALSLAALSMACQSKAPSSKMLAPTAAGADKAAASGSKTFDEVCRAPKSGPAVSFDDSRDFPSKSCRDQATALTKTLSTTQKIAQMVQPDKDKASSKVVRERELGSMLSGGNSDPGRNDAWAWAEMVNGYRDASLASASKIPMIYGIDAVHGHSNIEGAVLFPHNIGLGATRDADLVQRIARATALEIAATTIDWDFSPVFAVSLDERWGRTYEAFGETRELAESLGVAMVKGLQDGDLSRGDTVLACAKHFAADGATSGGVDQGDAKISWEDAMENHVGQYQAAVDANVGSVMVSYSSIQGVKNHCNGELITDTLKKKMRFNGLVISDWEAVEKIGLSYSEALASGINAGLDMIMAPASLDSYFTTMESLVASNKISMERIDDSVNRILAVKCELGLLEENRFTKDRGGIWAPKDAVPLGVVGNPAHRAIAREAVAKSLVVLENKGDVLPLKAKSGTWIVAGKVADDIGLQSGGWSIDWQGRAGKITAGTTIYAGIKEMAPKGVNVFLDAEVKGQGKADVAIVAIGEFPYAEGQGDKQDLSLAAEDVEVLKRARKHAKKVIAVLISGRPMILGENLGLADAWVAAWLPGTEGAGIADVLLGKKAPVGKLPHSWPRNMSQIPINVGDKNYDPLYAYGYGLTWEVAGSEATATPVSSDEAGSEETAPKADASKADAPKAVAPTSKK